MKRSAVNAIMREAIDFLRLNRFALPPFAFWTLDDWKGKGAESREIIENRLGWDITDFGKGDYDRFGLFLFTIRNGCLDAVRKGQGKPYAEKVMLVKEDQLTPMHFHFHKMEDIINRGGGELAVEVYNATEDEQLADTPVEISMDGVSRRVPAGTVVTLGAGESITLPTRMYHKFWGLAGKGTVLVGEVSQVNDDEVDNRFLDPIGRFPRIEEDEPPLHLLCCDYASFLGAT
ncbi:MAG: D-lyxose/D-mannose family sugar isomerase [Kiritimatiellae bacterium]|nr:D-lyxose/D-mannose family sugar isomerase [Kiritimatiellia bacterium]